MYRVVEYISDIGLYQSKNGNVGEISSRLTRIVIETGMTDTERSYVVDKAVSKVMDASEPDKVVRLRFAVTIKDSLNRRNYEESATLFVVVRQVKEKYVKYNILRTNQHAVKDILSSIVKQASSEVSIADAMEMIGISKEESAQYLNKEGNYDYPDLIGRWASLFSQENK